MSLIEKFHTSKPSSFFDRMAIVVLSGGQDSMTCLHLAKKYHKNIMAVSFDYGQRHGIELSAARDLCQREEVPHALIELPNLGQHFQSALLRGQGDVGQPHAYLKDLPSSFVPCRNALMLTYAFGIAMEQGPNTCLYTGVCQTDYSGYPDCREVFVKALENTLNVGYQQNIPIVTPLMWLNKAETWAMAWELGEHAFSDVMNNSRTCYIGSSQMNEWGLGCGTCPACTLRRNGFFEFQRAMRANA